MRAAASRVKPNDIFLCYLVGVMRWVGALEVIAPSEDRSRIWKDEEFPVRFQVQPLVLLDPEYGVPMEELRGKVQFFKEPKDAGKFKGFVRMSPNLFRNSDDGKLILQLLLLAKGQPIARPVDAKKLARKPFYRAIRRRGRKKLPVVVSVPDSEELGPAIEVGPEVEPTSLTSHTEMQYHLLLLGAELGLDVWVARNDRSKVRDGVTLGSMNRVLEELPVKYDEATNRTIELIDVLWLRGNSIVAAFEVEVTTSVYSGLIRMSDLLALNPNLDINLYLVAPDERREKVRQEILRPTFYLREKPLTKVCAFLPFSKLLETVSAIRKLGLAPSLKTDFLKTTAEFFAPEENITLL